MDPDTSVVTNVIALQYNPDSLSRTLQIQAVPGGQDGVRVDALRLRGPAIETIKLEAELDATDQLEFPNQFRWRCNTACIRNSRSSRCWSTPVETLLADAMANAGTLEIIPAGAAAHALRLERSRVMPVRLTEFSVTEEAFDPEPQPHSRQGEPRHARAQRRRSRLRHIPAAGSSCPTSPTRNAGRARRRAAALSVSGLGGLP
jgi:hypothetical protein